MTELHMAAVSGGLSLIAFAALPFAGTVILSIKRLYGAFRQAEAYRR